MLVVSGPAAELSYSILGLGIKCVPSLVNFERSRLGVGVIGNNKISLTSGMINFVIYVINHTS